MKDFGFEISSIIKYIHLYRGGVEGNSEGRTRETLNSPL
jgi:hypothetical protein